MPIKKAALKRLRSDRRRHIRNMRIINDLKTRIRKLRGLIAEKKVEESKSLLPIVISKLDKAAQKGVIHKNKASRTISRLKKALNRLTTA